jgi:hypothetical protein
MKLSKLTIYLILTLFLSCTNKRKEKLWDSFGWAQMRKIPLEKAAFSQLGWFDIVYQNPKTMDSEYNYPNCYVVGIYNASKAGYDQIHYTEGFNAFKNLALIKSISDFYNSDSTHLDNIQLADSSTIPKSFLVLMYKKQLTKKRSNSTTEYMMWKRETVWVQNGRIRTELIEEMNIHLF